MAKAIWQFTPRLHDPDEAMVTVKMPVGARVLAAREQADQLCLWAEVDPSAEVEVRSFLVFVTGDCLPENAGQYLGTALLYSGDLVLHVYEADVILTLQDENHDQR